MNWLYAACAFAPMAAVPMCTAQTDVHALEQMLKGKTLELRSYSAEPVLKCAWVSGSLESEPIQTFTLGAFTVHSVKLRKGVVALEGERGTVGLDAKSGQTTATVKRPMRIEVDLRGVEPVSVLPRLTTAIFFADLPESIASLPKWASAQVSLNPEFPPPTPCRCRWISREGQWTQIGTDDKRFAHAETTFTPQPEFSEEARKSRLVANVSLLLAVSETGRVDKIWLLQPFGMGLDEKALEAARHYQFKPATYDGQVVGSTVAVQISFSSF